MQSDRTHEPGALRADDYEAMHAAIARHDQLTRERVELRQHMPDVLPAILALVTAGLDARQIHRLVTLAIGDAIDTRAHRQWRIVCGLPATCPDCGDATTHDALCDRCYGLLQQRMETAGESPRQLRQEARQRRASRGCPR